MPGLHDNQVHLTRHVFKLGQLKLDDAQTRDEALSLIANEVCNLPIGEWLLGAGFATARL